MNFITLHTAGQGVKILIDRLAIRMLEPVCSGTMIYVGDCSFCPIVLEKTEEILNKINETQIKQEEIDKLEAKYLAIMEKYQKMF